LFSSKYSDPASRRNFFEEYAVEQGFDPLNPKNWYSQSVHKISSKKGAQTVIMHYRNNLSRALLDIFPDIGLEDSKFRITTRKWEAISVQREFFESCARSHGYDPLVAKTWYSRSLRKILAKKAVVRQVLQYHEQNLTKALLDLFPSIGLDRAKLLRCYHANIKRGET